MKKEEAQKRALTVERAQMQLEFDRAKQAVDIAKKNLDNGPQVLGNREELADKYRQALEAKNTAAVRRNALFAKGLFDSTNAAGMKPGDVNVDTGTKNTKTNTHNIITINIDKLIEKFSITTQTVGEGAASIKEQVVKALIEAVNDAQIVAGI